MWCVALNQALLSSCATTRKESSRPVQGIQRGAETVRALAVDIGYLRALGRASTLRGVGRPVGRFNPELLGVLGVQSLPAVELHGFAAGDAAHRLTREEPLKDVEADVPARGAPRAEAAIDVMPEREAGAVIEGLQLPAEVIASPAVLEQPRRLGPLHGALRDLRRR